MLEKTCSKNTIYFLNDSVEDLLEELSCNETSVLVGGFRITNNTDRTQTFYPFSSTVPLERNVLQPGSSKDTSGNYILFNSSRNSYVPKLQEVDPTGQYQFGTQGNQTFVSGINQFF